MMMKEFTERTGIYPTENLYKTIEQFYYDYDGNKDEFCKAYKANKNGLAEKIAAAAETESYRKEEEARAAEKKLAKQIEDLKKQLEREEEWKPYEDTHNTSQDEYDNLKEDQFTRVLSDSEATQMIYDLFGFAKEKIRIHRTVGKYEVNRHRKLRKVGEINRAPLYNSTDWNYIRFDCGCMSYELFNDTLRFYLH